MAPKTTKQNSYIFPNFSQFFNLSLIFCVHKIARKKFRLLFVIFFPLGTSSHFQTSKTDGSASLIISRKIIKLNYKTTPVNYSYAIISNDFVGNISDCGLTSVNNTLNIRCLKQVS